MTKGEFEPINTHSTPWHKLEELLDRLSKGIVKWRQKANEYDEQGVSWHNSDSGNYRSVGWRDCADELEKLVSEFRIKED